MSKPISTKEILKKIDSNFLAGKKRKNNKMTSIDLQRFKKMFNHEANILYAERGRRFIVDSDNKDFLNLFCKYFSQDISFETEHNGSLKKGLFVFGNSGSGKTSSFQIIQRICSTQLLQRKFHIR